MFKLPVYDVITPQTHVKLQVRCLTFNDELKLRSSILAGRQAILKNLNKYIYDLLEDKPEEIKTYKDFINKFTLVDRKAMILGLYHISYGNEFAVDNTCPVCGHVNSSKVDIEKHTIVKAYSGKPFSILDKSVTVDLPITGFKATIKVPVLYKEEVLSEFNFDDRLFEISLITDSIEAEGKKITIEKPTDLAAMLKTLPARDVRVIRDEYLKNFDYDISVKFKVQCSNCGNQFESEVDFVDQIFRMVL